MKQTLHTYSLLCGIAYSDRAEPQYEAMGYVPIRYINKRGVQAYILMQGKQTYCIIRGTDDLRDWMRNVNINTIRGINAGVYMAREVLIDAGVFQVPNNDSIIFMGHSLGGAIAHSFNPFRSYSFGSPRILLDREQSDMAVRVTNCNDIAPKLPPNLKHPKCTHLHLTYSGRIVENPSVWTVLSDRMLGRLRAWSKGQVFSGYYDHSLEKYQEKLGRALWEYTNRTVTLTTVEEQYRTDQL